MAVNPIQKKTISTQVAEEIRKRILGGQYPGGLALRQEHIAAELGISRIPVREALHQLHSEGLVTLVSHKGAVVSEISLEEIAEMFDLRGRLETWLLELAIPNMTKDDLARARASAEAYDREDHTAAYFSEANWQFHALLYAASRRSFTIELIAKIHRQLERYTRPMVSMPGNQKRVAREHFDLLRLCGKQDTEGAVALLRTHIMAGGDFLIERITALRAAEAKARAAPRAPFSAVS